MQLTVKNTSGQTWHGVVVDVFCTGAAGQIVFYHENYDISGEIHSGESKEIEITLHDANIDYKLLDLELENNKLFIKISSYHVYKLDLGEFKTPDSSDELIPLNFSSVTHLVEIIGGNISRYDSDGESEITVHVLVMNSSDKFLNKFKLLGEFKSKSGKNFGDLSNFRDVPANSFQQMRCFHGAKISKFKGSKLNLSIEASMLIDTVFLQCAGITIIKAENFSGADNSWGFPKQEAP